MRPPIRKYFLNDHEELLASEILVMFNEGRFISQEVIRKRAKAFYMQPWVMAERATFQMFFCERKQIFQDEDSGIYTDEFIQISQEILDTILLEGRKKPIISEQLKIIEDFMLPEPIFSNT